MITLEETTFDPVFVKLFEARVPVSTDETVKVVESVLKLFEARVPVSTNEIVNAVETVVHNPEATSLSPSSSALRRSAIAKCIDEAAKTATEVADRLKKWHEPVHEALVRRFVDELNQAKHDRLNGMTSRVLDKLIQDAIKVSEHLNEVAPLATRVGETLWHASTPTIALDASTRRREGYLLMIWLGFPEETARGGRIWRMLRRDLYDVGALRLRPYKDPDIAEEPGSKRTPVRVIFREWGQSDATTDGDSRPEDFPSADIYIQPADSGGLELAGKPWAPKDLRATALKFGHQSIGYFFIPGGKGGLQHSDVTEMLFRLSWSLCPHIRVTRSTGELRPAYRMVAGACQLYWGSHQVAGSEALGEPLTLEDLEGLLSLAPRILSDPATENTVVVQPQLLSDSDPIKEWFSEAWRVPADHRQGRWWDGPAPAPAVSEYLYCSPSFNGRPGWIERPDLSSLAPLPTHSYPVSSSARLEGTATRKVRRRRMTARIAPVRPVPCELVTIRVRSGEVTYPAWLLDYGVGGCRIELRTPRSNLSDISQRLLDANTSMRLRVKPGLSYPWPALDRASLDGVEVRLPELEPNEPETRLVQRESFLGTGQTLQVRLRVRQR